MRIENKYLEISSSFDEYLVEAKKIIDSGESYHGQQFSKDYLEHTKLNFKRMSRIYKQIQSLDFAYIDHRIKSVLIITEPWCGDAAQSIPILISWLRNQNINNVKIIGRDKNKDLMEHFLTDGSFSIPIALFLDSDQNVLFKWGPRPKFIHEYVLDCLKNPDLVKSEMYTKVQEMYNNDKGYTIIEELEHIFKSNSID